MNGLLTILPMSIVMIAGPQIISAVFLATSEDWRRNSFAYVFGAFLSITMFLAVAYFGSKALKSGSDGSNGGLFGTTADWVVLALLLVLGVKVYLGREDAEPPKWMGRLQTANPRFSFKLGFLLLGVFPTDILTSVTAGIFVQKQGEPFWHVLPFLALTLLFLGLPALLVTLMGKRAEVFLPKVRDWMNNHSWLVSEFVIGIFVVIQISNLIGD